MSAVDPPTEDTPSTRRRSEVITIGIDPHKRTHTAVAVSSVGELLAELTEDLDAGEGPSLRPGGLPRRQRSPGALLAGGR
jgi:hypothetical protein